MAVNNVFYGLLIVLSYVTCQVQGNEDQRTGRANLLAFTPSPNKSLSIGMDLELPFITIPIKRDLDANGQVPALVNIHTGSLITASLVAGGGLIVGHLFRSMFPLFREGQNSLPNIQRSERFVEELADEQDFLQIFDNFKFRYRNATGEKVETSMRNAISNIEDTLLERDVNLSACLEKSICSFVYKSAEKVQGGQASAMQKIANSASNMGWLMGAVAEYPRLYEAIKAGKMSSGIYCDVKYPECKWVQPDEKLYELVRAYVKFM